MKTLILVVVILTMSIAGHGQRLPRVQPCKVTPETLMAIRGLRLGMPYSVVKGMFKNLSGEAVADERGSRVHLVIDILQPQFSDVRKITFMFTDDELQKFELFYKPGTDFDSIETYSFKLSDSLGVPKDGWYYSTSEDPEAKSGLAKMHCYGFNIMATKVNIGQDQQVTLEVESTNHIPTLINRRRELEKRKGRRQADRTTEFKP